MPKPKKKNKSSAKKKLIRKTTKRRSVVLRAKKIWKVEPIAPNPSTLFISVPKKETSQTNNAVFFSNLPQPPVKLFVPSKCFFAIPNPPQKSFHKKYLSLNNHFFSLLVGLIFAGMFCAGVYVFATGPYAPPAPLEPGCAPGANGCTVNPPVPYTGATTNVDLGSNNFTAGTLETKYDSSHYATFTDQSGAGGLALQVIGTGATDSTILSNSGTLILGGNNNTYNQALKFDFETYGTGNEISITSAGTATTTNILNFGVGSIALNPGLGSNPSNPIAGQMYYNTVYGLEVYDSSGWYKVDTALSSLRFKHNVQPLAEDWAKILQVQPKSFVYNGDLDTKINIGYIAEDFDALGLKDLVQYDLQGRPNGINYDKISLYDTEILKQQQIDINAIKQTLGISTNIATINPAGTVGSGSVFGVNDLSVQTSLADLGATLSGGIMSLKQIIADSLTVNTASVKYLQMTAANGDIYCTWIDENGDWQKVKGDCANVATTAAQTPAPTPTPEQTQSAVAAASAAVQQATQVIQQSAQAAQSAQQAAQQAAQSAQQAQQTAQQAQQTVQQVQAAQPLNINSVAPISDINVDYGTALSAANLPTTATATMSDNTTQSVSITWDNGTPTYDPNTAATYVFSGSLVFSGNVTNTSNVKATVNVIVAPQPALPPSPTPTANPISQAASGLLNGVWDFIKWLIGSR